MLFGADLKRAADQARCLRCKALDVPSLVIRSRGVSVARAVHESRSLCSQFLTLSQERLNRALKMCVPYPKRMLPFTFATSLLLVGCTAWCDLHGFPSAKAGQSLVDLALCVKLLTMFDNLPLSVSLLRTDRLLARHFC